MIASKYKEYTDQELVSMCVSGDANAWEALIVRYRRLIYSVPVRFGFPTPDASDIYQVVCLKLIEHLHELKDESKVSSWLLTTTIRQCLHLKSLKYRETETDDDFDLSPDPVENVEELRIGLEKQQMIRESVDQLSGRCRELIGMLYFNQETPTYDEISRSLKMPVASIGPTRARCFDKLRTILRWRGIK